MSSLPTASRIWESIKSVFEKEMFYNSDVVFESLGQWNIERSIVLEMYENKMGLIPFSDKNSVENFFHIICKTDGKPRVGCVCRVKLPVGSSYRSMMIHGKLNDKNEVELSGVALKDAKHDILKLITTYIDESYEPIVVTQSMTPVSVVDSFLKTNTQVSNTSTNANVGGGKKPKKVAPKKKKTNNKAKA